MANKLIKGVIALGTAAVLCSLIVDSSWAGDGIWTQTGPSSDESTPMFVRVAPSDPMHVYALDGDTLYRSRDAGATWSSWAFPRDDPPIRHRGQPPIC